MKQPEPTMQPAKEIFFELIEGDGPLDSTNPDFLNRLDGLCAGHDDLRSEVLPLVIAYQRSDTLLDLVEHGPATLGLAAGSPGSTGEPNPGSSNILICLYDGKPVPKVIDFGLAKALHQPLTEMSLNTAHGLMVGTPRYMSPEQEPGMRIVSRKLVRGRKNYGIFCETDTAKLRTV